MTEPKKSRRQVFLNLPDGLWEFIEQESKAIMGGNENRYLSDFIDAAFEAQKRNMQRYCRDEVPNGSAFGKAVVS